MNKFAFENYIPDLLAGLKQHEFEHTLSLRFIIDTVEADLRERLRQIEDSKEGLQWLQGG